MALPRSLSLALILVALCAALWRLPAPLEYQFQQSIINPVKNRPLFSQHFASTGITARVHAPSVVEMSDGRLLATWFAGSREGAKDVEIHGAYFDPTEESWSAEFTITSPTQTQLSRRYIRKVGNPVITTGPDGQLWLFYVSVSIGGWSTSQINLIRSVDLGASWSLPKRLISSPAFNLSTLVKGNPFLYQDGTLGLPAYHELAAKFGEILRISAEGDVIGKKRLAVGRYSLQPVVLIEDEKRAQIYQRYAGEKVPYQLWGQSTDSGGLRWSRPEQIAIPNPNSALTGLRDAQRMLLVLNDTDDRRDRLSLEISTDNGLNWQNRFTFEDRAKLTANHPSKEAVLKILGDDLLQMGLPAGEGLAQLQQQIGQQICKGQQCTFQYDYPYMVRSRNGDYHLLYTWNRSLIKHIRFNDAWLEQLQ
ncbi:MAG: exo-alpha-sialidase [Candidatus Polarisedimenticolaceae bacterium]|nr:exo-alpha-sialidase [Candidatus Polarisedimenticolaceae bacterium]